MGDLSAHFDSSEFRSRACRSFIGPPRELIDVLERLRALKGRPIRIVSGYRCASWNRSVGGARHSRHMKGDAADLEAGLRITVPEAIAAGAVGVGYTRAGYVVHIDVRPGPVVRFLDE